MRIGVLGLGRMGAPIAAALSASHDLVAFDPRADRGAALAASAEKVVVAAGISEVVSHAEALITVLPGPVEFRACADEVVEALVPGALWIDVTSNDPRVAENVAESAASRGIRFVAAPMSGGPADARSQGLRFSLGGSEVATQAARQILEPLAIAGGVTVIGESVGAAYSVKLLGNLLWFGNVVAVTEAMLLGTALGIDAASLRTLLASGPGGSVLLERDYVSVLDGEYLPEFGLDRVVEELDTLKSLADERAVPFELSGLVAQLHSEALQRFGPVDGELLVARLLEERAGRYLRDDVGATGGEAAEM